MTDLASKPKLITGRTFAKALEAAGIVTDLNTIARIVIDVRADRGLELHVLRLGDERLLGFADMLTVDDDVPSSPMAETS